MSHISSGRWSWCESPESFILLFICCYILLNPNILFKYPDYILLCPYHILTISWSLGVKREWVIYHWANEVYVSRLNHLYYLDFPCLYSVISLLHNVIRWVISHRADEVYVSRLNHSYYSHLPCCFYSSHILINSDYILLYPYSIMLYPHYILLFPYNNEVYVSRLNYSYYSDLSSVVNIILYPTDYILFCPDYILIISCYILIISCYNI